MGILTANPNLYNMTVEGEVSSVLAHFDLDFALDLIEDRIDNRFVNVIPTGINMPASFETRFKQAMYTYPDGLDELRSTRTDIYQRLLTIICNKYGLIINLDNIQDLYSASYYLYDLLVSRFYDNMTLFFTKFIIKEKNSIYDSFNMNDYKKSKDSNTLYSKKLYKNIKLAIINSNLDYVIDNICIFDISFVDILNNIYEDKNIVRYIDEIVKPSQDFFKSIYVQLIQGPLRPIIMTNIRLEIQKLAIDDDITMNNIAK